MDSIQKNHPSGSLLFLKVNSQQQVITERQFEAAPNSDVSTEYLVLDGQQRLTSCYYVFYNKGPKSYYLDLKKIFELYKSNELKNADLDENKIIKVQKHIDIPDGELNNHLFPMGCFSSRTEFKSILSKYKRIITDKESDFTEQYSHIIIQLQPHNLG